MIRYTLTLRYYIQGDGELIEKNVVLRDISYAQLHTLLVVLQELGVKVGLREEGGE